MFLTKKTPEGPQRREEDIETNLPCSCTPDGSQCYTLTVNAKKEKTKFVAFVARPKIARMRQKTAVCNSCDIYG